jgi:hypothetical protein
MNEIKYPIEVKNIILPRDSAASKCIEGKSGSWVAVRPCGEKYGDKTYLGLLLGDLPISCMVSYNKEQELEFFYHRNPAMYVPELKEIIYGCGSWWSILEKSEDLQEITDLDIQNVWYVKALKELSKT